MMKTYSEINEKIASGKAVVLTAEEVIGYVDKKGLEAAAKEIDVVTTATFGPMCSSSCVLNFGHSKPKIRMTEAWICDVQAYCGIAQWTSILVPPSFAKTIRQTCIILENSATAVDMLSKI